MSTLLIWSDEFQKLSDLLKENKKAPVYIRSVYGPGNRVTHQRL